DAEAAGVADQRHCIKAAHAGVSEIISELRGGLFAVGIDFVAALANMNDFLGERNPLEQVVERSDVGMIDVDLRGAGHGTEFESSAMVERDRCAFVRNDSVRRIDDRL